MDVSGKRRKGRSGRWKGSHSIKRYIDREGIIGRRSTRLPGYFTQVYKWMNARHLASGGDICAAVTLISSHHLSRLVRMHTPYPALSSVLISWNQVVVGLLLRHFLSNFPCIKHCQCCFLGRCGQRTSSSSPPYSFSTPKQTPHVY